MSLTRPSLHTSTPLPTPYLNAYSVVTSAGAINLLAYSRASAISSAIELLGGTLRSCTSTHDW